MKEKKSPKADIEKKRLLFLMIGVAVALASVYILLEWSSTRREVKKTRYAIDNKLETEIVVTQREKPKPPTPPAKKPTVRDIIEVTTSKLDAQEDLVISTETDENDTITFAFPIEPNEEIIDEKAVFVRAEKMPIFPGGDKALLKFLSENIKYPQIAADNGVQGKVYLKFIVKENGNIGEVQVLRSPDKLLEKEAIRVVKMLPKFSPGMQRNTPVKVWYQVPVTFRLQ